MSIYIVKRLLLSLPTLLLVSFIIFSLVRIVPGDVVIARVAESGYFSEEDLDEIRAELGLDRPFFEQYGTWLWNVSHGDLGRSLWSDEPVLPAIVQRLRVSAQLAIFGMAMAVLISVPLGVLSAISRDSPVDYGARLFAILGLSLPDFWIATVLILFLILYVGWLPEFGYHSPFSEPWKNFQAMIFPTLIVGYRLSAISSRMMRSTMLEVLRNDYVRTARAKGLAERTVLYRHALPNAALPVITIMGAQLTSLLGGLVVIETIFSLPGVGRLTFDAVTLRDYTVVQGTVMVFAGAYVFANLVVDLSYAVIDPRIRYS